MHCEKKSQAIRKHSNAASTQIAQHQHHREQLLSELWTGAEIPQISPKLQIFSKLVQMKVFKGF